MVYLAPGPAQPFRVLTLAITGRFPECPPYGDTHAETVPRMTVAHTRDRLALDRVANGLLRMVKEAIHARANALTLLARTAGRWHTHALLPLGG